MKIVLGIIGAFALLIAAAMVKELYWPARQMQPVDPYAGYSPMVRESYRIDKERSEKLRKDEAREKEVQEIMQRAYKECRERKISDAAVLRCVNEKVN